LNIIHAGNEHGNVTINTGVTTVQDELAQSALFRSADQALCMAKAGGRDRVAASTIDM